MNENKLGMNRWSILIAEDDPDDRLLIAQAFEEIGFRGTLHFVKNGEELISCLSNKSDNIATMDACLPACILLDLNMPLMDGREALRQIRRQLGLASLSIVVLTTSESESDKKFCAQLGATAFITKPPRLKALAAQLLSVDPIYELSRASKGMF